MEKQMLLAVDGSESSLQATMAVGSLLKDHPEFHVVVFHCVQQLATLYPGEVASGVYNSVAESAQEKAGSEILKLSRQALLASGFPGERIRIELKRDSTAPARDVLIQAEMGKIRSIACGRRGRTLVDTMLLGSVSKELAQSSRNRTVWIVDTPMHDTRKALIAIDGDPTSRALTYYAAEAIAPIPSLQFTIFHVMPPVSPTFWDDGHILGPQEEEARKASIRKWEAEYMQRMAKFMSESRDSLVSRGVPPENIETRIQKVREGIARDLLNEIALNQYQLVVIGKRSFKEKKPFHIGSNANKILQGSKGSILCLVDD